MLFGLFLGIVSAALPAEAVPTQGTSSYVHQQLFKLSDVCAHHICPFLNFEDLIIFYRTTKATMAAVKYFWEMEGNDEFDLTTKHPHLEKHNASYFAGPYSLLRCFRSIRIHCPKEGVPPVASAAAAGGPGMFGVLTMMNSASLHFRCCSRDHEYWKEPARAKKLKQLVDLLPNLRELKTDGEQCLRISVQGDSRIPNTVNDCFRDRLFQDRQEAFQESLRQLFENHRVLLQGVCKIDGHEPVVL